MLKHPLTLTSEGHQHMTYLTNEERITAKKAVQKNYYEKNKEKVKARKKRYYENNKEKEAAA